MREDNREEQSGSPRMDNSAAFTTTIQTEDREAVSLLPCHDENLDSKGAGEMAVDLGSTPLWYQSSGHDHSIVRLKAMTAMLCGGFFSLGIVVSLLGPTLLDLACNTSSNLGTLAYLFTARSSGYLTGSIIGGCLFDKFEANILLAISQFISAAGIFAVPFCTDVVTLALCIVSGGIAMGFLDTGGNVQLLRLWGTKSAPYMQALHFAFGIGALVAPLIAKPFLRATPSNGTSAELTTCTDKSDSRANMTDICGTSSTAVFQYSYSIAAIVLFIMGLNFMYFAFAVRFCPSKATHTTQTIEKGDNKNGIEKSGEPPHNRTYLRNDFCDIWRLCCSICCLFSGLQQKHSSNTDQRLLGNIFPCTYRIHSVSCLQVIPRNDDGH